MEFFGRRAQRLAQGSCIIPCGSDNYRLDQCQSCSPGMRSIIVRDPADLLSFCLASIVSILLDRRDLILTSNSPILQRSRISGAEGVAAQV